MRFLIEGMNALCILCALSGCFVSGRVVLVSHFFMCGCLWLLGSYPISVEVRSGVPLSSLVGLGSGSLPARRGLWSSLCGVSFVVMLFSWCWRLVCSLVVGSDTAGCV